MAQSPPADTGEAFAPDHVVKLAQALAVRPFQKPKLEVPEPFSKLSREQHRDIRFRPEQAIWRGEKLEAEVQLFAYGWIYDAPVEIFVVDGGRARALKADGTMFSVGQQIPNPPHAAPFGFSGFRLHGPVNRSDYYDEYAVFQGASFFRSVGRGQIYGLSARGLAINVGRPSGEEVAAVSCLLDREAEAWPAGNRRAGTARQPVDNRRLSVRAAARRDHGDRCRCHAVFRAARCSLPVSRR